MNRYRVLSKNGTVLGYVEAYYLADAVSKAVLLFNSPIVREEK